MRNAAFALGAILAVMWVAASIVGATGPADDESAIRDLYKCYSNAIAAKNLDAVMSVYAPDVVAFHASPPRRDDAASYRKDYERVFAAFPGPTSSNAPDTTIKVEGNLAYSYGLDHWTVTDAAKKTTHMTFRFTDVLEKRNGKWLIVHEHVSFPIDPETGVADLSSGP